MRGGAQAGARNLLRLVNDVLQVLPDVSGWMALVLLALATFLSEDLACVAGGLLVISGELAFVPVALACTVGIFVGDALLMVTGRILGRAALRRWPLQSWARPEDVERVENWFRQRGAVTLFFSRFVPGSRLPTYVLAGIARVPWLTFVLWCGLACLIWTPLLVAATVVLGDAIHDYLAVFHRGALTLVAVGGGLWGLLTFGRAVSTWKGRRLLYSRWRRLMGWEFWPMWAVYPPVIAYIALLSLRYRCLTLFTAVNPGIGAGGGLKGESKSEILRGLAGAGDAVAAWTLIPPGPIGARMEQLEAFLGRLGGSYPVVLKPDVGERGSGVVIAHDAEHARSVLQQENEAFILQRYVPGVEYGVFYYRFPGEQHGRVLAITDKRMVGVTGDGASTLEQLILRDARAVCMAQWFLAQFRGRLSEVPAPGERVMLTQLGTHCRGALFLDGSPLLTDALLTKIDEISRSFTGFYFGRYDVRAADEAAFRQGEFHVIELNGLTSEATSIYDPKHSVVFGWSMLCRQWRIALRIAAANRAAGHTPLTVAQVWRLLRPAPELPATAIRPRATPLV